MIKVLRESPLYVRELDQDTSEVHLPHKSWGTYRVVDRTNARVLFSTPNRDKSIGVFEYVVQEADRLRYESPSSRQ